MAYLRGSADPGTSVLAESGRRCNVDVEIEIAAFMTELHEEGFMQVERPITAAITVGDQPSEADLERLKREGYVGVVNLRQPGEPEQPLSPTGEGAKVEGIGMEYLHYGVGGAPLSEPGVTAVSDFVDRLAEGGGKVLVHCRRGPRAFALVLLQQARANNWKPEEAIARGKAMGLEVDGGLRMLVETYLQQHG
jgi:uncharacterized protein (TIGR01244 family)